MQRGSFLIAKSLIWCCIYGAITWHCSIAFIIYRVYKDEFGARELKRTLTSNVEDLIAENKINGVINSGDKVTINSKNDKLEIKVSK